LIDETIIIQAGRYMRTYMAMRGGAAVATTIEPKDRRILALSIYKGNVYYLTERFVLPCIVL
jgi:hypothetical protein